MAMATGVRFLNKLVIRAHVSAYLDMDRILVCFFRWSAIAARLPGRTDNEIKNVWHTHLKKRLEQNHLAPEINGRSIDVSRFNHEFKTGPETVSSSNVVAAGM
ncbi:hypothetical protein OIU76_006763 [Salix suchowensis]|nr:hypothetical protein OIU76_006763 [Salix suchowensis]